MKPHVSEISSKELILRLNFLLCIEWSTLPDHTPSTYCDQMELTDQRCTFFIMDKVKQSQVGHHIKTLEFMAYSKETTLCLLTHIREYIS